MRKVDFGTFAKAVWRFVETTSHRLRSLQAEAADLEKRLEDVRTNGEDLEERLAAAERQVEDLEDLADRLRPALVAVLSHAIRRQHLPQGFTFDSELWVRLRDLGGDEACAVVTVEIEGSQAVLRRSEVFCETDPEPGAQPENDLAICD